MPGHMQPFKPVLIGSHQDPSQTGDAADEDDDKESIEGEEEKEDRGGVQGFLDLEKLELRICCNPLSEDYLSWKERTIANAKECLSCKQSQ